MIVDLKKIVFYVLQMVPETKINGERITSEWCSKMHQASPEYCDRCRVEALVTVNITEVVVLKLNISHK